MNTILKVIEWSEIPENYTGIVEGFYGTKAWYLNGGLHRLDGPAVEWFNGDKRWYLNGNQFTEQEYWNHPLMVLHRLETIF